MGNLKICIYCYVMADIFDKTVTEVILVYSLPITLTLC